MLGRNYRSGLPNTGRSKLLHGLYPVLDRWYLKYATVEARVRDVRDIFFMKNEHKQYQPLPIQKRFVESV